MNRPLRAALVVAGLLANDTASAQDKFNWTPTVLYAGGRAADQWSTQRFLTNGSGCVEASPLLGPHPSVAKLTAFNALGVAAVAGGTYALNQMLRRAGHPTFARRLNLALGGVGGARGVWTALQNVRACRGTP